MSRTKGARNADHAERRAELVGRLRTRLADRSQGQGSLRELAASAEVSIPTLRHHFGGREDVVAAVLEAAVEEGRPYREVASAPQGPFEASVRQLLGYAAAGHCYGVGDLHAIGLTEGLGHATLGRAYVQSILEPTQQAVETRLAAHVAAGEMPSVDLRHAALALIAPLLLAQLHQGELGGRRCRPLDLETLISDHAQAFVRAY